MIAAAGKDKNVYLLHITTGKELGWLAGHQGRIQDFAFSPDGKRLATTSSDTTVLIWDATDFLHSVRR